MYLRIDKKSIIKQTLPFNKNILVLSPHPDDDVIGMGAMLYTLAKSNNVRIFYLTSGFRGVKSKSSSLEKAAARRMEAINSTGMLGIKEDEVMFLNLPFYNKGNITTYDIDILKSNLRQDRFDYIYVCADFKDPHGTHYKCFKIFKESLEKLNLETGRVLLYKGIWENLRYEEIDYVFLFKDNVMNRKIEAIKAHTSQIEPAYPGEDKKSFWQKTLDFNRIDKDFFKVSSYKYLESFSCFRNSLMW